LDAVIGVGEEFKRQIMLSPYLDLILRVYFFRFVNEILFGRRNARAKPDLMDDSGDKIRALTIINRDPILSLVVGNLFSKGNLILNECLKELFWQNAVNSCTGHSDLLFIDCFPTIRLEEYI